MKIFRPDIERMILRVDVRGLIRLLTARNWEVRRDAASALMRIRSPLAVEPLMAAMHDPHEQVRWSAALALAEIYDPRAYDSLVAALRDTDPSVREAAAYGLGNLHNPQAVPVLVTALGDPESNVRYGVVEALGKLRDVRAVEPLIAALCDPSPLVRFYAARALGQIGDPRALDELERTVREDDGRTPMIGERVADAAQSAIEKIREQVPSWFSVSMRVRCVMSRSDADESRKAGYKPSPGDENRFVCVAGDEGIVVSIGECEADLQGESTILGRQPYGDWETGGCLRNIREGYWIPVRFDRLAPILSAAFRIWKPGSIVCVLPQYLERTP